MIKTPGAARCWRRSFAVVPQSAVAAYGKNVKERIRPLWQSSQALGRNDGCHGLGT